MLSQARDTIESILRPVDYDRFFDEVLGQRMLFLGEGSEDRSALFSGDPRRTITRSFASNAPRITAHAANPSGPAPGANKVGNPRAFDELIRAYHKRGHTVRIPAAAELYPELARFVRALEMVLLTGVDAEIFWSAQGLEAPVHYDNAEIFAIQLLGRKRWFISDEQPRLPNQWKAVGEAAPRLNNPRQIDMTPGDLLYIPRGTSHTVNSTTESIHLSIGFTPITMRDAVVAAIDRLADLNRPLRAGLTPRADDLAHGRSPQVIEQQVVQALGQLAQAVGNSGLVREALDYRTSRFVGSLPGLQTSQFNRPVTPETRVRRAGPAFAKLVATADHVDFSQPGGHFLVHRGAETSLRFLASNDEFRVRDIPGPIDDEVRTALVRRFVSSGYLEPVDP